MTVSGETDGAVLVIITYSSIINGAGLHVIINSGITIEAAAKVASDGDDGGSEATRGVAVG